MLGAELTPLISALNIVNSALKIALPFKNNPVAGNKITKSINTNLQKVIHLEKFSISSLIRFLIIDMTAHHD
jgi:hypothetical protein